MKLNNHLLYVDITNKCNLNCEFCMYKEERKRNPIDLKLNKKAKITISNILNQPETERLIISGEGEPFNNINCIYDILKLSKGNKKIQIITNGLWLISDNSKKILNRLDNLQDENNDKYQIRISFDTFHIKRIGKENYKKIIQKIIQYREESGYIEICFRGILEEKDNVLSMLNREFLEDSQKVKIESISRLETNIIINKNQKINFIFKNLIDLDNIKKQNSFEEYIRSLEEIYKKPFTLGHLKMEENGMDITIKPNGDLFFYGAEIYPIFNIFFDEIDIKKLQNALIKNKILKKLYTIPLLELIKSLKKYKPFENIIQSINNPYWIIKRMYEKDKNKFEELINVN